MPGERSPDTMRSQGVAGVQAAMRKHARAKLNRPGPMALLASAWGQEFELVEPAAPTMTGGVAVVMIMGPLTHHGGDWWFSGDTYDAIEERVKSALESSAQTVVLKIDSTGGDVDGCFECSRTLRAMAKAAGKNLVAYVDETAASAAYALACAADSIYMPPAGKVGSIGVIAMVADQTAADAQMGLKYTAFTSGARKADGCPHVPLSPEAAAEFQRQVDSYGLMFAELVAESRKVAVAEIQRLEAGVFQGADALRVKLADGVMSFNSLLALLASGQAVPAQQSGQVPAPAGSQQGEKDRPAMKKYDMALSALRKLAEGGDEGAKLAVAMLEAEEKKTEAAAEETAPPSETEEEPPASEEGEGEQAAAAAPAAQAASTDPVVQALALAQEAKAEAAKLRAERQAEKDAAEIKSLLDARTDLDPKARALLEKKSLAYVKEALEFIPRVVSPAAAAQVNPTLGAGQGGVAAGRPSTSAEAAEMDARMGLAPLARGTRREGNELILPVVTTEQAKARLAELNKINGGA